MNNKKKTLFWVSKLWIAILNVSFLARDFTEIQGPFSKKHILFSSKAIHHCKPSSFYLPNMEKYNGTYKIILKKLIWE